MGSHPLLMMTPYLIMYSQKATNTQLERNGDYSTLQLQGLKQKHLYYTINVFPLSLLMNFCIQKNLLQKVIQNIPTRTKNGQKEQINTCYHSIAKEKALRKSLKKWEEARLLL